VIDLLLDKNLPGPAWIWVVDIGLVRDEVLDKRGSSRPAIDAPAHLGVERDRPIQQQRCCGRMLQMAGIQERFVHRGKIVRIRIETCANATDVAERGKEFQRSGKKASVVKEIDQPLCAGLDEGIAYRRGDDCAGIEQEFGTRQAREVLLACWVGAIAVGPSSHAEQTAVVFIRLPRQQRRVFRQQLPQTFDVIVMDSAAGLVYGPLQSFAETLLYFFYQVLPAGKPIFARQHELGITLG
jgi:hypothetical protein